MTTAHGLAARPTSSNQAVAGLLQMIRLHHVKRLPSVIVLTLDGAAAVGGGHNRQRVRVARLLGRHGSSQREVTPSGHLRPAALRRAGRA